MRASRFNSAAVFVVTAFLILRVSAGGLVTWQGRTMGSPYTVQIVDDHLTEVQIVGLKAEIDRRLKEVNRQMSHYENDSELSRFNRAPAHVPFKVSPEFARVVRFTLDLCRQSRGALDPTLAPVINLWGFGEESGPQTVPSDAALAEAIEKTGWKHLCVTENDELIKEIPELTINLGAVAKGFGVDEMVQVLQAHGLTNIYASIAGEVRVLGHNSRGTAWKIGISAPVERWNESDPMAAAVALSDRALSTSGDYQQYFYDKQGRRRCHIIDPATGRPVQYLAGGVSVTAPDSMTADALGTILFVLGPEKGISFIESRTNAAALFILREPDGRFRKVVSSRFSELAGYPP